MVIGSGAGGGTLAYALSKTTARVLIVERGDFIPQEEHNWDPEAVWKHLRYQTRELWLDANGREFPPYSHYNVGGNSKFWGSVLYRLRREDFQDLKHLDGLSYKEISERMGIPEGTVMSRLFHARRQLRERLTLTSSKAD